MLIFNDDYSAMLRATAFKIIRCLTAADLQVFYFLFFIDYGLLKTDSKNYFKNMNTNNYFDARGNNSSPDDFYDTFLSDESFKSLWIKLSPENGCALERGSFPIPIARASNASTVRQNSSQQSLDSFQELNLWCEILKVFALPCHSFAEERDFAIDITKDFNNETLNARWRVSNGYVQANGDLCYELEMFVCKRKIYEQSVSSPISSNLEFESFSGEFARIKKKYENTWHKNTEDVFRSSLRKAITLEVTPFVRGKRDKKRAMEVEFTRVDTIYQQPGEKSGQREQKISGENAVEKPIPMIWRITLSNYWATWADAAQRAHFDFDYLSRLTPIEIRFYELINLLRFGDFLKSVDEIKREPLKITYDELIKLMPLSQIDSFSNIKRQINTLCKNHLASGFLKKIDMKKIEEGLAEEMTKKSTDKGKNKAEVGKETIPDNAEILFHF